MPVDSLIVISNVSLVLQKINIYFTNQYLFYKVNTMAIFLLFTILDPINHIYLVCNTFVERLKKYCPVIYKQHNVYIVDTPARFAYQAHLGLRPHPAAACLCEAPSHLRINLWICH